MAWPAAASRTPERRAMARAMGKANRLHGHANPKSPTYNTWRAMKERCDRPAHKDYSSYGGRGIGYDPRWSKFINFLTDMGERPHGMTLDRIDPNGDYCKDNCRWADAMTQRHNRRSA